MNRKGRFQYKSIDAMATLKFALSIVLTHDQNDYTEMASLEGVSSDVLWELILTAKHWNDVAFTKYVLFDAL